MLSFYFGDVRKTEVAFLNCGSGLVKLLNPRIVELLDCRITGDISDDLIQRPTNCGPWTKSGPPPVFVKFFGTQTYSFLYVSSVAAFVLQ